MSPALPTLYSDLSFVQKPSSNPISFSTLSFFRSFNSDERIENAAMTVVYISHTEYADPLDKRTRSSLRRLLPPLVSSLHLFHPFSPGLTPFI